MDNSNLKPAPMSVLDLNTAERLRLSILHGTKAICKITEESCENQVTFDKEAVTLISTLVWQKLQEMGLDLEYFAKHAKLGKHTKRTIIRPHDVLLLARRNRSLKNHLTKLITSKGSDAKVTSNVECNNTAPNLVKDISSNASDAKVTSNVECNDVAPNPVKDISMSHPAVSDAPE